MKKILIILFAFSILYSCRENENPYPGYIIIENDDFIFNESGGSITTKVETDASPVTFESKGDWYTAEFVNGEVKVTTSENKNDEIRRDTIKMRAGFHDKYIYVTQKGIVEKYVELANTGWSALCSSEQINDGGGVSMIFTSIQTRYWHSAWDPMATLPHWIDIDMKREKEIGAIRLGWRQSGVKYFASTKKTELLYSNDGKNYTSIGFILVDAPNGLSNENYAPFHEIKFNSVKARYVKLLITESNAANGTCNLGYFKAYAP